MQRCLFLLGMSGLVSLMGLGCGFLTESATSLLISPEEEVALGLELAAEVESELVLHPDAQVQATFQAMGNQLVAVLGTDVPKEYVFTFHVVQDDATVNAFAAPGGQIYFYTGLFLDAGSEAAVMGVLAHEIAHVTERHGAKQLIAELGIQSVLDIALGGSGGDLTSLLTELSTTGALLSYSRSDETEADVVGLGYVVAAGYDPNPFADFFATMGEESDPISFLSTHPDPAERALKIKEMIAELPSVPTYTGDPVQWDAFLSSL